MAEWLDLIGGGVGGALLTSVLNRLLSRRKDSADSSKAEADAINAWQSATKAARDAVNAADDAAKEARKDSEGMYQMLQAMRTETDAKITEARAEQAAELSSLRIHNETLTAAVESMARQLDQRTVDQAEVEWARMRNSEYEAMKAELVQLRTDVAQVPYLRAEVARLTELLQETQREQRLDHEALRESLTEGSNPNG